MNVNKKKTSQCIQHWTRNCTTGQSMTQQDERDYFPTGISNILPYSGRKNMANLKNKIKKQARAQIDNSDAEART